MPRFFDDYSNTYLTHDSAAGRKQQRRGWKFRENFRVSRIIIIQYSTVQWYYFHLFCSDMDCD